MFVAHEVFHHSNEGSALIVRDRVEHTAQFTGSIGVHIGHRIGVFGGVHLHHTLHLFQNELCIQFEVLLHLK